MRWHDQVEMWIRAIQDAEREVYDGFRNRKGDVMRRRIPGDPDDQNESV